MLCGFTTIVPGFEAMFILIVALFDSCQKRTVPTVLVIWYWVSVPLPIMVAEL